MVFTSINFLLFFPAVILLFYITPIKYRWATLLVASYFFYLNIEPVFGLLTALITLSTYLFTRLIDKVEDDKLKSRYMYFNIIIVLLPLFFFKYFTAINDTIFNFLELYEIRWVLPKISFLLPVGISFYTFMAIGYTIDVYNEEIEAEKNIGIVALFISFFPLILSGPIERAQNMIPQFKSDLKLNPANFTNGLKLMLWGYFMKLVVADHLGEIIDLIYNRIYDINGSTLMFATALYPFQVYCDLGGYSLIAIGTSKILGLNVMHNFKRPFFSVTMGEFWRRWHISLISWLTDYLYTPLSFYFRKYKVKGIIIALLITFLLSGIWHGAALTFVVWGIAQGIFLSIEAFTQNRRSRWEQKHNLNKNILYLAGCMFLTYIIFTASMVFGKVTEIETAFIVFKKIFTEHGNLRLDITGTIIRISGLLLVLLKDFNEEFLDNKYNMFSSRNIVIRYTAYLSVLFIILLFGVFDGDSFIYFQF